MTTTGTNDIVIVYTLEALDLQTSCTFSVSDTAGLTWTARSSVVFGNSGRDQIQEFYAKSASALSSDSVTESISGCASTQYGGEYNGLLVFGVSGANFNNPFDPNSSALGTASGSGSGTSVNISTSNSNDIIISGANGSGLSAGSGFTLITSVNGNQDADEYKVVHAPLTSSSVTFAGSSGNWEQIADALRAPISVDGSNASFCGHNTNSCTASLTTSNANDIIIVYALEALDLQTSCTFSVSDTAGLTWTARSSVVFGNSGRDQIQEFYAKSA
ncbi:hypothetical protein J2P12_06195, partial [Candidatus Bathyarchaeota archaeon]|nr:hypothetical protein [Candidatus Bathyarchaeota archaeon]